MHFTLESESDCFFIARIESVSHHFPIHMSILFSFRWFGPCMHISFWLDNPLFRFGHHANGDEAELV